LPGKGQKAPQSYKHAKGVAPNAPGVHVDVLAQLNLKPNTLYPTPNAPRASMHRRYRKT
jgi:hypothetical protein